MSTELKNISKGTREVLAKMERAFEEDKQRLSEEKEARKQDIQDLSKELKNLQKQNISKRAQDVITREINSLRSRNQNPPKVLAPFERLDGEKDDLLNKVGQNLVLISNTVGGHLKGTYNEEDYLLLKNLSSMFNALEKKANQKVDTFKKGYPKPTPSQQKFIQSIAELERLVLLNEGVQKIATQLPDMCVSKRPSVSANSDYPYDRTRASLAKQCVASSSRLWNYGYDWAEAGDVEMFAVHVADAQQHYELARAFLDGHPHKIDSASNMDTSPREELSDEVYDFINTRLDYKKKSTALKRK